MLLKDLIDDRPEPHDAAAQVERGNFKRQHDVIDGEGRRRARRDFSALCGHTALCSARSRIFEGAHDTPRFTSPRGGEVDAPTGPREARPDDRLRASGEGDPIY